MNIADYFNNLIDNYNNEQNKGKKNIILINLKILYLSLLFDCEFPLIKSKVHDFLINNTLDLNINVHKMDILDIDEEEADIDIDYANSDLIYLRDILKHINISRNKIVSNNMGSLKQLESYIKVNDKFYKFYNAKKFDVIIDDILEDGFVVKLINNYSLFLSKKNITTYLHELIHIYNKCDTSNYSEAIPILSEMSVGKTYNIKTSLDRADDLIALKKLSDIGVKDINDLDVYKYGIGALIGLSFINVNGTNFNDILLFNSIINNNKTMPIYKAIKLLNINERDIIDSINNYEKVLSYKK